MKRNWKWSFIAFWFVMFLLTYLYKPYAAVVTDDLTILEHSQTDNGIGTQVIAPQVNGIDTSDAHKVILLWNSHFNQPDFGVKFGTKNFQRTNCSRTCFITNDGKTLSAAAAVVIHAFSMGASVNVPTPGHSQQVFVFVNFESPIRSWGGMKLSQHYMRNRFNLTMTYMIDDDTDIQAPMGVIKTLEPPDPEAILAEDLISSKTKLILWVVSNCDTASSRNEYAEALGQHIPVDIFGECGAEPCPRPRTACFGDKGKDYMFYLAFENSFCKDYVTEKAFRTLSYNMVPVVLGRANYIAIMPPDSYIDVRDFDSPKDLAKYLLYLQKHTTEYRKYFRWRSHYQVYTKWWHRGLGFCRLCEILNTPNYPYKQGIDVRRYWNPKHLCLTGDEERKSVHLS